MSFSQIISLFCGIALFLFGMSLMGDGLKKVSGDKLEPILYKVSGTPLRGVLLGTGVTAVIQSSSATTVMIVGFVSAGMMKVSQGISVILGAILGTSITGWVICLSYIESAGSLAQLLSTATLTGLVAVIGILLRTMAKKQTTKHVGDILMGFVVLMMGMSTMSGAVSGLGDQPWFTSALTSLSNPLAGILVGALFTALLQSASAAVGIVQALSVTGAMQFEEAFPLLLGISVGAAAPVLLTALGANHNGKRIALVYPIITALGTAAIASLFYIANAIVHFPFLETVMNPFSLAAVNTVLRLFMVVILFPFMDAVEALVRMIVPDRPQGETDLPAVHLEDILLAHPALALEQCRITMNDMALLTQKGVRLALDMVRNLEVDNMEEVRKLEQAVDDYQDALGSYLVKLTGRELSTVQNEYVSKYLHTISDLELISDQSLVIAMGTRQAYERFGSFSGNAGRELVTMAEAVENVTSLAVDSFIQNDLTLAEKIEPLEEIIDNLCDTMKINHVARLQKKICTINQGLVFNDIISGCERVSDHCSNIAIAMIVLGHDTFDMHEYLNNLREERSSAYQRYYEQYKDQYHIELESGAEDKATPFVRSAAT
ncbi:MAG: Na/Pi cotransporter family protein [Eubacteriales bacterium]|nr:Na/Pi cotransporter family protein [Eubacteriales bacterium]